MSAGARHRRGAIVDGFEIHRGTVGEVAAHHEDTHHLDECWR
jgi:hypothetical protein